MIGHFDIEYLDEKGSISAINKEIDWGEVYKAFQDKRHPDNVLHFSETDAYWVEIEVFRTEEERMAIYYATRPRR